MGSLDRHRQPRKNCTPRNGPEPITNLFAQRVSLQRLPGGGGLSFRRESLRYLFATTTQVRLLLKNSMFHNHKYFVLCVTLDLVPFFVPKVFTVVGPSTYWETAGLPALLKSL